MSKFSEFDDKKQSLEEVKSNERSSSLQDERYSDDTKHRKYLVLWVICLSSAWLLAVTVILFLCGGGIFHFDSAVFITLLATTTATVLGLPVVVLKGLFK